MTHMRITISRLLWVMVLVVMSAGLGVGVTPARSQVASSLGTYILQGEDVDQVMALVRRYGGVVSSRLDLIHGVAAQLDAQTIPWLLSEKAITQVTPNGSLTLSAKGDHGKTPAGDFGNVVGANLVWSLGVNGKGVTMAVVDTGLGWHPGLFKFPDGRERGRILAWKDFVEDSRHPKDPNGHGTHVAGVIANSQNGDDDEWNGIAPWVSLVGVRVADEAGSATYERVIQGIQWVVENRERYNIRVLNFSMSAPVRSPYWADPVNQALMAAWAAGIVVVTSAGNNGPGALSIGVPGNNPYVITVGGFTDAYTPDDWRDDYIPPFSSAGPTHDGFIKPDVVAPGGHIVSTMLPNSLLARTTPENRVGGNYFKMSGTSPATAVVSGVVALMLSYNPALTPDQVKHRLHMTAIPQFNPQTHEAGYSVWQQGAGRVFAPLAVFAEVAEDGGGFGMDIQADLAGAVHYVGYSYRDQEGIYRLFGDDGTWAGGAGVWDGISIASQGGLWSDGGFWGMSDFWGDRGFWGDSAYWGSGGFWGDRGFWRERRLWGHGGFWGHTGW